MAAHYYALVQTADNKVISYTIAKSAPASTDTMFAVEYKNGTAVHTGMFYDKATDKFYDDAAFTTIDGVAVSTS